MIKLTPNTPGFTRVMCSLRFTTLGNNDTSSLVFSCGTERISALSPTTQMKSLYTYNISYKLVSNEVNKQLNLSFLFIKKRNI